MDARGFYGEKIHHHRFLQDAVDSIEAEDTIHSADVVVTGVQEGGIGSDEEDFEDDDLQDATYIPTETAVEVDVIIPDDNSTCETTRSEDCPRWRKMHIPTIAKESSHLKPNLHASKKLSEHFPELSNCSEWDIFLKIFDDIIELLVVETNTYAQRDKNCPSFSIDKQEMLNFLGLVIMSGYNLRTNLRDYWSRSKDLECPLFAETMSRNRFLEIKKYFHAANNTNLSKNKMAKVKPLYDILNEKLSQFGVIHEVLSIDESMTPYYGKHSCKQYIRGKPIRFGFKSWILASSTGMPYSVSIYEGKGSNQSSSKEPLGTRVINDCISVCSHPENHHYYFDNFFTSYDIILNLKKKGIRATGTIRQNRMKNCPILSQNEMKKKARGYYDFRSDGDVEIVTWNDNSVVSFCSNAEGVDPLGNAKRRQKGKGTINVDQPHIVKEYNAGMGGVDLLDRSLAEFRPRIRGKKWYYPLIIAAINIGLVFTWRLFEISSGSTLSNKDFRRTIVLIMVNKKPKPRPSLAQLPGPKGKKSYPASEVRSDNVQHYPEALATPRRCALCKKNCRNQCPKCSASLHLNMCWQKFHEK